MRHYPTVLSADSPHQTTASPVIFGSAGTGGVTALRERLSLPGRLSVGNTDTIQTLRVCFCFYFPCQGSEVPHLPKLRGRTSRQLDKRSVVWHLVRHVNKNRAISTSIMLPSQRGALSKQQAGSRQTGGGKPPCDPVFVKESLWCSGSSTSRQVLKITTVVVEPWSEVCYRAVWRPECLRTEGIILNSDLYCWRLTMLGLDLWVRDIKDKLATVTTENASQVENHSHCHFYPEFSLQGFLSDTRNIVPTRMNLWSNVLAKGNGKQGKYRPFNHTFIMKAIPSFI